MKTQNACSIAYAVLNSAMFAPIGGDGWCQLMPAGRVKARDGRPEKPAEGWLIDKSTCERLVSRLVALNQPIKVDYNHQTLYKGEAAPAAGYIHASPDNFAWRDGDKPGIYVRPDWNPPAVRSLEDKEYAWLSPVMGYDTVTGEPVELRMVALTGDPGLTGMESVVALSADDLFNALQPSEFPMNEKLRQLLAKLGITVPENAQLTDEQATAALSAVIELQTKAGSADSLQTQVTALSAEVETAKTGAVDLTKYVPRDTYDALRTDFVALSANHSTATLAQVLDDAEKDGRIFKSERSYFEQVGGQIGVAALSAQLQGKQPIAALATMQTQTVDTPATKVAALSAEDIQTCRLLGMTEDEFRKAKEEDAK
ncbi:TPA: protease [Serratia marcescens]|uniref:Protease n=1 Tax=Serratia marcescens TaxID=615 RepID=A0AB33FTY3_SERMA|nr:MULTISPECIES: phage protease [Serratia]AKL43313.1 protease [Serratia marcescens]AWL70664.1 protease [Serratia marcescens]MDP8603936.1 phage protease [Serratia marcescens]MDP8613097.1 phage protease [Serratia marcescens]MDP8642907.1 phage protease [Serratia marcescens]